MTPEYASPEQVLGVAGNYRHRRLLAGRGALRTPHRCTAPSTWIRTCARRGNRARHLPHELPPPSTVTPGLPRDLDNIVMMAMRKDPDRRYPSVDQFAADVRRYLDGRPVLARQDSLAYRAGKFVRRNRLMIAAASLVVASLVGGIVIATSQARRAERRLTQMVELANRSLFDVHSAIERLPGAMDARREIVRTTIAYLENLSKDAGQDDDLRLSMATAYWRLGDIQGYADKPNLGDLKGALASFTRSAELLQPLRAKRPKDPVVVMQVVDTYQHMGRVLEEIGDVPASERAFENGLPEAKRIAALRPGDVESNEALGIFLNDLAISIQYAQPQRAYEYCRQHLDLIPGLLKKFPGNDNIADEAAVAHATMSALLHRAGNREDALKEALESASIREGVSSRHPNDVFRRRLLMIAYGHVGDQLGSPPIMHPGDLEGSKVYFEKCVGIARGIVQTDPQDRTGRYDLANSLLRWGNASVPGADLVPSLAALRESVAILESLAQENPQATRFRARWQWPINTPASASATWGAPMRRWSNCAAPSLWQTP